MQKCSKIIILVGLISLSFSVMAKFGNTMSCPSPETIEYIDGKYTTQNNYSGFEGQWISQKHTKGIVEKFSSAQYVTMKKKKNRQMRRGILLSCQYFLNVGRLSRTTDNDLFLTYKILDNLDKEEISENNSDFQGLLVSLIGQPYWEKLNVDTYVCTKSAADCTFTPLKVIDVGCDLTTKCRPSIVSR